MFWLYNIVVMLSAGLTVLKSDYSPCRREKNIALRSQHASIFISLCRKPSLLKRYVANGQDAYNCLYWRTRGSQLIIYKTLICFGREEGEMRVSPPLFAFEGGFDWIARPH